MPMEILRIEHPAKSYRKEKMLYKHSLTKNTIRQSL